MRLYLLLFFMLPCVIMAQWGVSPNQAMVKGSVEQSVVVVCSAYKLQDSTGQHYGRNNRPEFNQSYSIGVVTDSGLIMAESVLQPWAFDADFARYSHSHKPVLSVITYRRLSDSVYKSISPDVDSITPFLSRIPIDSVKKIPPLAPHIDTTYSNGWLLWVYASDTLGKAGLTSTTAIVCSAVMNDSITSQRVNAPLGSSLSGDTLALRKPVGAVWVVPCYPKAGLVQFRVAGITVRDSTGWQLVLIRLERYNDVVGTEQRTGTNNELTPTPEQERQTGKKNKKKNKK